MKFPYSVVLMFVVIVSGLVAIVGVFCGTCGVVWALLSNSGGFVGEEGFYASALFFLSLPVIAVGAASGIVSYVCWARLNRRRADSECQ
jgi:hypothetical protein